MNILKKALLIILPLLFVHIFTACEDEYEHNYVPFLIKVDSIQLPENVNVNESFDIAFFGNIGTNGCYQFSEFKSSEAENEITIEAWGKFNKSSDFCTMAIVMLAGEKLNYTIAEKGTYTFKIKQTDGSFLETEITVE